MLILLLSCVKADPQADRRLHAQALETVAADPAAAAALCARIDDPQLHADCVWVSVEALASTDPELAASLCADTPGAGGEECWFLLGEHARDPSACANAGSLADDCRMHVFSDRLNNDLNRDASFGGVEATLEPWVVWAGLNPSDPRPWSALYRQLHARTPTLDPANCAVIADPDLQASCRNTAVAVFHDRLNRARDRGAELCTGALPFPVVMDASLQAELDLRREQELCREDLRRIPSVRQEPTP